MKKILAVIVILIICVGLVYNFGTYKITNLSDESIYNVKFTQEYLDENILESKDSDVMLTEEIAAGETKIFLKKPMKLNEGVLNLTATYENDEVIRIYEYGYVPPFEYENEYVYSG